MMAIERRIVYGIGVQAGPIWMRWARRTTGSQQTIDLDRMHPRLTPYFDADLLDEVEVRIVERVRTPGARIKPAGLCLGRIVVIARDVAESDRFETVLFHELVHCVQMQRMGEAGFCGAYLAGWWMAGRSYRDIPLEIEAFALQDRFMAGEVFRVRDAVRAG